MINIKILVLIYYSSLLLGVTGCLFPGGPSINFLFYSPAPPAKDVDEESLYGDIMRKDQENHGTIEQNCVCGSNSNTSTLYIYIVENVENEIKIIRTCIGGIISSNIIATSHDCFLRQDHRVRIYDTLEVKQGQLNFYPKENIIVSSVLQSINPESEFGVSKLIFNQRFGMRKEFNEFPKKNLVLVVLEADFTSENSNYSTLCLPIPNEGRYSSSFGFAINETEDEKNLVELQGESMNLGECVEKFKKAGKSIVMPKPQGGVDCVKFTPCDTSVLVGSPLISVSYLIGVLPSERVYFDGSCYLIYTDILEDMREFVVWRSNLEKTRWCRRP